MNCYNHQNLLGEIRLVWHLFLLVALFLPAGFNQILLQMISERSEQAVIRHQLLSPANVNRSEESHNFRRRIKLCPRLELL